MNKGLGKAVIATIWAVLVVNIYSTFSQTRSTLVSGDIVVQGSNTPIEFATVMVGDPITGEVIAGTTADLNGHFEVRTSAAQFFVEISFLGFNSYRIDNLGSQNGPLELGIIELAENSKQLDEVVVRGEKSTTEFKLDKRVFNVGKDLSSTGASAYEVLNNVPSVNVNIEGEISLRGSTGVQILINGKPSVLASEQGNALGTITADMIEAVEVITNPSAKYDAEGTSGIINIVIKKEERKGLNGSISVNAGTPHANSIGLSLNRRTEKFNLFSQLGVGYRVLPNDVISRNLDQRDQTSIYTEGTEYRNEFYYNFVLGTDYHINDLNVVTVTGNYAFEIEDQPSETRMLGIDANNQVTDEGLRTEATSATNPKIQYEVNYKKLFDKDNEDHALLMTAMGNFFGKSQSSDFINESSLGDEFETSESKSNTKFQEGRYTFKADYTQPFSEDYVLEAGAQYVFNDVSNDFAVDSVINNTEVPVPELTNIFEYDQGVLGVYGTAGYDGDKWGYKLGLRVENTALKTLLRETNEANDQNYTNFFPTAHLSFKFNKQYSLQAGYSRRIYRPRLWDLNPFFNIRNSYSIRAGNPDLQPEFTDSYEVASIYDLDKASLNFTVYHRLTTDVIDRVSTGTGVANTTMPVNLGTERSTGIEFNTKYDPVKWMTVNADFNYFYFERDGVLEDTEIDFSADQWSTKVTSKFKLPAKIDLEVTGRYQSAFQTVQGSRSANLFADFGARKKIMDGKGVINVSVRDVFASRVFETDAYQNDFYRYSRRQRGRFITLGFSYGFGKGEAMEYSGQRRR